MTKNVKNAKLKKTFARIAIALGAAAILGGAVFGITKGVQASKKAHDELIKDLEGPSELLEGKLLEHISENKIALSNNAELDLTGINYNFGESLVASKTGSFDVYGKVIDQNQEFSFSAKYTAEAKVLENLEKYSTNLRRSTYKQYVAAITQLFEEMELVDVYVNQGEAVHESLQDRKNQEALIEVMEARHQKARMEINARFIEESQTISPIFERAYTVQEDGKTYAVLHMDFEETQLTKWSSQKLMNGKRYYMKKNQTNYFIRSEIFKVEVEPNQTLDRDQIVNLIVAAAKEKSPTLTASTDFMKKGSDNYISNATQYLNEARQKTAAQSAQKDQSFEM